MCAESILKNTDVPFKLVFLDFGYSRSTLAKLRAICAKVPMEIVNCGRVIPMVAFKQFLPQVTTRYLAWVDNDTYVTPGWMTALLDRAAQGAKAISPVTFEREGLDTDPRKVPLRNHISHGELRRVTVDGVNYLLDHKPFRRATPEELPQEPHTMDFFELHAFFGETEALRQIDWPPMVVREHLDAGIQFHRLGIEIWGEPKSQVIFDNIHERPTLGDLRFFFFRWDERLVDASHELFAERWGYRFATEQFMKNWAFRRKVFSLCRFMFLPSRVSDLISRALNKFFRPALPPKLAGNLLPQSERLLVPGANVMQPVS
jgi:hypothetical protein